MTRWALGLSYDGSNYHGWQAQTGLPTVQGELEQALARIADHSIRVQAAGRTDAGVHATAQVAGFSSTSDRDTETWLRGLNGLTGDDIRVEWVEPVGEEFHARYSATGRRYHYLFHDQGRFADPLLANRVWHCQPLDADTMHRAAQSLLGEHNFSSFRAAGCQSLTPWRRVDVCSVRRVNDFVVMEIEANAFLLHMVRNIASALHDIGRRTAAWDLADLLSREDRNELGITAPAGGLYLTGVSYAGFSLPRGRVPPYVT